MRQWPNLRRFVGPLGWTLGIAASVLLGGVTALAGSVLLALYPPDRAAGRSGVRLRDLDVGEGEGVLEITVWHRWGRFESLATARSPRHGDPPAPWFQTQAGPADVCPGWVRGPALPWEDARRPWPAATVSETVIVQGFGWPAIVLWSSHGVTVAGPSSIPAPPPDGSVNIWRTPRWLHQVGTRLTGRGPASFIPVNVSWRGLVTGAAALAPVWAGLFAAAMVLARVLRRLLRGRGCCRACGYDLRGLAKAAPCPECGSAR